MFSPEDITPVDTQECFGTWVKLHGDLYRLKHNPGWFSWDSWRTHWTLAWLEYWRRQDEHA